MSPDRPGLPRRLAGSLLAGLCRWAPVAIALAFFAQLALLGLRPAIAERQRLAAAEQRLEQRLGLEEEERGALSAFRSALEDPIYRERLRLHRLRAAAAPE
jgi:hypothetical protein